VTTRALAAPVPKITVHDPVGDVPFPQGDLTGAGFGQNATSFTFAVTVVSPTDPNTDPAWQDALALVGWAIDTNNDGVPEYLLGLVGDFPGATFLLSLANPNAQPCTGTGAFIAHSGYRATFKNSCLPAGIHFRFQALMQYTTDANDLNPPVDFAPDNGWSAPVTTVAAQSGRDGYWMLGADGRVYPFGGAVGFAGLVPGAVAMAPGRDGRGYWVTDFGGRVYAFGTARYFGGSPRLGAGESVSTISATPSGGGYWLFTNRGRVFPFGNASSFGDMSGTRLNGPIVASVATPSGRGYYLVGSDGGIFSFGDARFHGSTGGLRLHRPVVGIAPTPAGTGYWLVASDGGVFAFNAPFRGSMGAVRLAQPVDGLVAFGNGYLMAAADGGVFNFSNRAFAGSLAAHPPTAPIIGLAAFST